MEDVGGRAETVGFRLKGGRLRVDGLVLRVLGLGFRVSRLQGLDFEVHHQGAGMRFRDQVQGRGLQVWIQIKPE